MKKRARMNFEREGTVLSRYKEAFGDHINKEKLENYLKYSKMVNDTIKKKDKGKKKKQSGNGD